MLLQTIIVRIVKKWNDRKFAAGVDRSVIKKGASMLGVSLNDLITDCIIGMRTAAEENGLKGSVQSI